MVPLKFLRKRSSRFGATCWGITTHQANRADGLCKYCKGLPHPSACASLWVVIPQHVAPNLELLFPNYFSGTYGISVQFFFDWSSFSNGVVLGQWKSAEIHKQYSLETLVSYGERSLSDFLRKKRQWDRKSLNSTTELNSTLSNSGVEFWNLDVEFWNSNSTSKFQIRHLNSTESNLAPLSNL